MVNKLYEVIRKHPNKDALHDITVGSLKYKKGEKIGFNIFVKDAGSEKGAEENIALAKKRKWIKDFGDNSEENGEKELVDYTKKELIAFAEDNNIELENPKGKNKDIIAEIELALSEDDSEDDSEDEEEGSEE